MRGHRRSSSAICSRSSTGNLARQGQHISTLTRNNLWSTYTPMMRNCMTNFQNIMMSFQLLQVHFQSMSLGNPSMRPTAGLNTIFQKRTLFGTTWERHPNRAPYFGCSELSKPLHKDDQQPWPKISKLAHAEPSQAFVTKTLHTHCSCATSGGTWNGKLTRTLGFLLRRWILGLMNSRQEI